MDSQKILKDAALRLNFERGSLYAVKFIKEHTSKSLKESKDLLDEWRIGIDNDITTLSSNGEEELKCTSGELFIDKEQNHSLHIISRKDETFVIATVYSDPLGPEDIANAERIVKAWNCYDDLYNALKELILWGKVKDGKFTFSGSEKKYNELKQLLQKANPQQVNQ